MNSNRVKIPCCKRERGFWSKVFDYRGLGWTYAAVKIYQITTAWSKVSSNIPILYNSLMISSFIFSISSHTQLFLRQCLHLSSRYPLPSKAPVLRCARLGWFDLAFDIKLQVKNIKLKRYIQT